MDAGGAAAGGDEDYANEPPLLEGAHNNCCSPALPTGRQMNGCLLRGDAELGINLDHIRRKTEIVLKSAYQRGLQIDSEILADADMAGPLVFCLALGGALLLVCVAPTRLVPCVYPHRLCFLFVLSPRAAAMLHSSNPTPEAPSQCACRHLRPQHGKVHFGAIYALALLSVAAMYVLLNLMSTDDVYRVVSVLGCVSGSYCLQQCQRWC